MKAQAPSPGAARDEFAARWLAAQEAFWERFQADHQLAAAQLDAAETFWDEACRTWWDHVRTSLPTPLGTQLEGALQQTRIYLRLAREMARSSGADLDDGRAPSPDLGVEPLMRHLLDTWIRALDTEPSRSVRDSDAHHSPATRSLGARRSPRAGTSRIPQPAAAGTRAPSEPMPREPAGCEPDSSPVSPAAEHPASPQGRRDDGTPGPQDADPATWERRYLLAYSSLARTMSGIAADALAGVGSEIGDGPTTDPLELLETVCNAMESEYRKRAASEDFCQTLGALVNARVRLMPAKADE